MCGTDVRAGTHYVMKRCLLGDLEMCSVCRVFDSISTANFNQIDKFRGRTDLRN